MLTTHWRSLNIVNYLLSLDADVYINDKWKESDEGVYEDILSAMEESD